VLRAALANIAVTSTGGGCRWRAAIYLAVLKLVVEAHGAPM
jgi:hypothetical protein